MNRKMIKSIRRVLSKLEHSQDSIDLSNYTIDGDEVCQDWLINLKLDDKIHLFPDFYSAWLRYRQDNYLVLVNFNFSKIPNTFLQEEILNSGAWVAIIDILDLSVKKDTDNILLEILESGWNKNDQGYIKLNIETDEDSRYNIKDCFPNIYLYKIIGDKFTTKEALNQITGIALIESNNCRLLPYTEQVVIEFKNTFENGDKNIPFENILVSYLASDFKFAYLDLYRCIERLRPLRFLKSFYEELALENISLEDFYIKFYENLKLEPKLENSLNDLLRSIDIDYQYANRQSKQNNNHSLFLNNIKKIVKEFSESSDEMINSEPLLKQFLENLGNEIESIDQRQNRQNNGVSSLLYRIRNQIVHLRPKQKDNDLPKSHEEWNLLILDMLRIVQELYKINQDLENV